MQSVCSFGSSVKLRKVNLIINPAGTVIVELQKMFRGKLLGKFGLLRNPLVPVRSSPHSPAKQNSYDWPHGERVILTVNILSKFIFCLFHNLLKEKALRDGSRIFQGPTQPNEILYLRKSKQVHFHEKR